MVGPNNYNNFLYPDRWSQSHYVTLGCRFEGCTPPCRFGSHYVKSRFEHRLLNGESLLHCDNITRVKGNKCLKNGEYYEKIAFSGKLKSDEVTALAMSIDSQDLHFSGTASGKIYQFVTRVDCPWMKDKPKKVRNKWHCGGPKAPKWTGKVLPIDFCHSIDDLIVSRDNTLLWILSNNKLYIYNIWTEKLGEILEIPTPRSEFVEHVDEHEKITTLTLSPYRNLVLLGGNQGTVLLADVYTEECFPLETLGSDPIADMWWSEENRIVLLNKAGFSKEFTLSITTPDTYFGCANDYSPTRWIYAKNTIHNSVLSSLWFNLLQSPFAVNDRNALSVIVLPERLAALTDAVFKAPHVSLSELDDYLLLYAYYHLMKEGYGELVAHGKEDALFVKKTRVAEEASYLEFVPKKHLCENTECEFEKEVSKSSVSERPMRHPKHPCLEHGFKWRFNEQSIPSQDYLWQPPLLGDYKKILCAGQTPGGCFMYAANGNRAYICRRIEDDFSECTTEFRHKVTKKKHLVRPCKYKEPSHGNPITSIIGGFFSMGASLITKKYQSECTWIEARDDRVTAVCVSETSELFCSGTQSGHLYLYEPAQEDHQWTCKVIPKKAPAGIEALLLSPDNKVLWFMAGQKLYTYEFETDSMTLVLDVPRMKLKDDYGWPEEFTVFAVSPDTDYVVFGGTAGTLLLGDIKTKSCYTLDSLPSQSIEEVWWTDDNTIQLLTRATIKLIETMCYDGSPRQGKCGPSAYHKRFSISIQRIEDYIAENRDALVKDAQGLKKLFLREE